MRNMRMFVVIGLLALSLGCGTTYANLANTPPLTPQGGVWLVQERGAKTKIVYCHDIEIATCSEVPVDARPKPLPKRANP